MGPLRASACLSVMARAQLVRVAISSADLRNPASVLVMLMHADERGRRAVTGARYIYQETSRRSSPEHLAPPSTTLSQAHSTTNITPSADADSAPVLLSLSHPRLRDKGTHPTPTDLAPRYTRLLLVNLVEP